MHPVHVVDENLVRVRFCKLKCSLFFEESYLIDGVVLTDDNGLVFRVFDVQAQKFRPASFRTTFLGYERREN